MYEMDMSINQSAFPHSDAQPNRRRRKKSPVWDHFTVQTVNPDCVKAFCNQCKRPFAYITGSKLAGTSHLKRHISQGICPVARSKQAKDQMIPHVPPPVNGTNIPRKRCRASNGVTSSYFDGDSCSYDLTKMIIQHGYPLGMVEQSGFVDFTRSLQPQFNIPSVSLLQEHITGIYVKEKQRLMDLLSGIPGRVHLTVDLCSSNQGLSYVLLTGHFTDHDWKLQRRILNVVAVQFPDSEKAFAHAIAACLRDWVIEDKKLCTITVDLGHATERAKENLRNLLQVKNSDILKGQLSIHSCYAHTLRSLALDALGFMSETIHKVRQSVKYVKTSDANEERFTTLKQQLQIPSTKNLMIDDLTQWNTTYQMLVSAFELKDVFYCLNTYDPDYELNLSMDEWERVKTLCSFLQKFYEAAKTLTLPVYPTTNSFFDGVWKIYFDLLHAAMSQDLFESTMTRPLLEKFTKFWEGCNQFLAIAVVVDPRFKMKFVQFSFSKIYGDGANTLIETVDRYLRELFLEYVMDSPHVPIIEACDDQLVKAEEFPHEDGILSDDGGFLDFDMDLTDIMSSVKSELDQYLEESVLPRVQDFDVLGWWKVNRSRYPILSKLASDVLSIPLSTVPPESVFNSGERQMDSYMSSLRPKTLQALICAKDWLQHPHLPRPPNSIPPSSETSSELADVKAEL